MQEAVVNPREKDGKQGMKHKKVDPLLLNHEEEVLENNQIDKRGSPLFVKPQEEVLKNNKIKEGAHYLLNHKRRSSKIKKSPLLFKP